MIIAFELTMPDCGSWNGVWTGEKDLHVKCMTFKKDVANKILNGKTKASFSYSWSDGWRAGIKARVVDSYEKKSLMRKSKGFCGYDWMIDSIIKNGKIVDET